MGHLEERIWKWCIAVSLMGAALALWYIALVVGAPDPVTFR